MGLPSANNPWAAVSVLAEAGGGRAIKEGLSGVLVADGRLTHTSTGTEHCLSAPTESENKGRKVARDEGPSEKQAVLTKL